MNGPTLTFAGIAALLVITPGADMALVTKNGLAHGRRAALVTALGVNLGALVWTVAAALGVATFVRSSAAAFNTLRIAGAAYLLYLGLQTLWTTFRRRERLEPSVLRQAPRGSWTAFRQGVVSNLLNPKLAVFYTSLLPQFVAPGQSIFARSLLLGGMLNLMAIIWLASYAWNLSQNESPPTGCDRRVRDKDAGNPRTGSTGATEDAVSRRRARPDGGTLLFETSS